MGDDVLDGYARACAALAGNPEALGRHIAKAQRPGRAPQRQPIHTRLGPGFGSGGPSRPVPRKRGCPSPTWREAKTWAKANLRGTHHNLATGWNMTVSSNGIAEGIHRLAAAGIPEAIAAIPGIIAHAVPIHSGPDLKNRKEVHQVHTLAGGLTIDGQVYRAVLTVMETNEGHRYHGHQVESLDIEMFRGFRRGTLASRPSIWLASAGHPQSGATPSRFQGPQGRNK